MNARRRPYGHVIGHVKRGSKACPDAFSSMFELCSPERLELGALESGDAQKRG